MDSRIVQYYRLCGVLDIIGPLYEKNSRRDVERVFTGKHVEIMLRERDGLFVVRESVIGGRKDPAAKIVVYTD